MTRTKTNPLADRYWIGAAVGWVALGAIVDLGNSWAIAVATLAYGAATAAVMPQIVASLGTVDDHGAAGRAFARIYGYLVTLAAGTVILGVLFGADGARHPVTVASLVIAVVLMATGPRVAEGIADAP